MLRTDPGTFWGGLAPHDQLAYRYALRISRVDGAGWARRYHDVLWLLRDGGDFPERARLEMVQDPLRTTLLTMAGEPAPLPAEHAPRLAGFSWFAFETVRVYVTTPADGAGVDLDLPAGTKVGPRPVSLRFPT